MFKDVQITTLPQGNRIVADGHDLSDEVMGWKIVPVDGRPNLPAMLWIAVMPDSLEIRSEVGE